MLASPDTTPLGQLLIGRGVLQPPHLELALDAQRRDRRRRRLGEILVERQWCAPEQVAEALAHSYGMPFARVSPRLCDAKVIGLLPREFMERHRVLPLFRVEGMLTLAAAEPADLFVLDQVARLTGCQVQVVASTSADIQATLQAYLPADQVFVVDDLADEGDPNVFALDRIPGVPCALPEACEPAVLKLVRHVIATAVHHRATEIHVEPGEGPFRVRYRIDGRLTERRRPPASLEAAMLYRLKWMAGLDPAESRRPQSGVMRVTVDRRPVVIAVATAPGRRGEKLVLRIADAERAPMALEKLGFAYDTFKQFGRLLASAQGLVLVSGPLGGGRRTTLYSCLAQLNADDLNLSTVEDPVEASLVGAVQVQVDASAGLAFPEAVAAVLAQSPDVLMISDLRDRETVRLATQAAADGRLVLAGTNAPDALAAIDRLLCLGAEPYLLSAALAGSLAQRLVRKLCTSCRESYAVSPGERRQLEIQLGAEGIETLHRSHGCERCAGSGFAGRIGLHELLVPDEAFRQHLSGGADLGVLRAAAQAGGFRTLRMDGLDKARAGITTLDEVCRLTPAATVRTSSPMR